MKNEIFEIDIHHMTGGIERLAKVGDPEYFNWCRGRFGIPKGMNFLDKSETLEDGIRQVFAFFSYLDLIVERKLTPEGLKETYTFKNTGEEKMDFDAGELGIYATFADSADIAEVALPRRAHSHIWCGDNTVYILNSRMNGVEEGVGLALLKGSLVKATSENGSYKTRGDVVMELPRISLQANETYTIEWLIFPYKNNREFWSVLDKVGALTINIEKFNYSKGETAVIHANAEKAILFGVEYQFNEGVAEIPLNAEGEQKIDIYYGDNKHTFINIFVGDVKTAELDTIISLHGIKKFLSRKNSATVLIEARKNIDWYKKIGDDKYLRNAKSELLIYYNACRGEHIVDIGIPEMLISDTDIAAHFLAQLDNALKYKGLYNLYQEASTLDMLIKAYRVWGDERYLEEAKIRNSRISAWLGVQPDYKYYKKPDLYYLYEDCDILNYIDTTIF